MVLVGDVEGRPDVVRIPSAHLGPGEELVLVQIHSQEITSKPRVCRGDGLLVGRDAGGRESILVISPTQPQKESSGDISQTTNERAVGSWRETHREFLNRDLAIEWMGVHARDERLHTELRIFYHYNKAVGMRNQLGRSPITNR